MSGIIFLSEKTISNNDFKNFIFLVMIFKLNTNRKCEEWIETVIHRQSASTMIYPTSIEMQSRQRRKLERLRASSGCYGACCWPWKVDSRENSNLFSIHSWLCRKVSDIPVLYPPSSLDDILSDSETGDTLPLQGESCSVFSVDEGPQPWSQNELNDLVRDLSISKGGPELLRSRMKNNMLKVWNFIQAFYKEGNLCNDVQWVRHKIWSIWVVVINRLFLRKSTIDNIVGGFVETW